MKDMDRTPVIDPDGFNELRQCRSGPLLYNKHDIYIGGSLRKYGEFSAFESELFAQLVTPGMFVVEVGANIGTHTVDLARLVTGTGRVHAFEPQRLVFQTLCANVAINQLTNVVAYPLAVSDQPGMTHVQLLDPYAVNNFGGLSLGGDKAGEDVTTVTLDQLGLPACHFLKIDVEGMETAVINGAFGTIESYRPVMYVENDRTEHSPELIELISSLGYQLYWHLPRLFNPDNYVGESENIYGDIVSANMLCFPRERNITVSGFREVSGPNDTWNAPKPK